MIKHNKQMHKRCSTYANYISIGVAAAMVYVPEVLPVEYTPIAMMVCAVTVALCQAVTKNAK